MRGGEHHDLDVRVPALDLVEAGEAVHVRHADVEEDEVGLLAADEREHLRPGLRLPDDLEVAVRLERPLDPVEDEPVVVGDYDAHGAQCRTGLATSLSVVAREAGAVTCGDGHQGYEQVTRPR